MLSKRHFLKILAAGGLTAPALVPGLSRAASAPDRPGFFKAKEIAEAGFIYGLPLVMNYGVMYEYVVDKTSGQFKAPFNQIYNEARVFTYQDTSVPTPNSDTPYSLGWLDLRAEPQVISVPAVDPKRYYSVQLVDGNTFNYGYIGSRSTGNDAGDFLVVGPRWTGETPPGIRKVFRASTDFALTIFRTQLFDAADIDNVKKVQAGYQLRPLSAFLGKAAPPAAPVPDFPKFTKDLARTDFFEFLDFALQFSPALPEEREIRAQLATIGVGAGKSFDFKTLSLEDKAEILLGLKEGQRKVTEAVAAFGTNFNGWRVGSPAGDAAFFNGDWLLRAVGAQAGIYGNDAVEATYPMTRLDADGQTLDGSKHNYTLTFPADGLPPVNAFWSVTMYDGVNQLLIKNPIDRYLINSPMLPNLKRNADGSVTLLIQNKSPGPDKESNWLPAPDGPIYLVMRLYWPKETPPSILPAGKGTWQPPGIRKA
ncbi:protein of unknown function DUF1214 [Xanthobacter versatilis]|uniref:DUF1254 domain-containing protein n=1 Tax=Xanthobacter autotrophicus (strain ATCC BAA-1158 / Py2) TaxID=78245 RepID=A7ILS9_XANP2|nr:protein of unknown function DUF1214 [Xanthobacter autotrophicus Py2]